MELDRHRLLRCRRPVGLADSRRARSAGLDSEAAELEPMERYAALGAEWAPAVDEAEAGDGISGEDSCYREGNFSG